MNSYLLNKYDKQRMPYENRGKEYEKHRKREERKKELYEICQELFEECANYKRLQLTNYQKERVIHLVDTFGDNFKILHGQSKKETIILAFIFYIKINELSRLKLKEYTITSKYQLNDHIFEIIVCKLAEYYMKRMPIVPHITTKYDHEILSKNGGVK